MSYSVTLKTISKGELVGTELPAGLERNLLRLEISSSS